MIFFNLQGGHTHTHAHAITLTSTLSQQHESKHTHTHSQALTRTHTHLHTLDNIKPSTKRSSLSRFSLIIAEIFQLKALIDKKAKAGKKYNNFPIEREREKANPNEDVKKPNTNRQNITQNKIFDYFVLMLNGCWCKSVFSTFFNSGHSFRDYEIGGNLGKPPGLVVNVLDSQSKPWSLDVGSSPDFT